MQSKPGTNERTSKNIFFGNPKTFAGLVGLKSKPAAVPTFLGVIALGSKSGRLSEVDMGWNCSGRTAGDLSVLGSLSLSSDILVKTCGVRMHGLLVLSSSGP